MSYEIYPQLIRRTCVWYGQAGYGNKMFHDAALVTAIEHNLDEKLVIKLLHSCQRLRSKSERKWVEFYLTFDEWFYVWNKSGNFPDMGRGAGQYSMTRIDKTKPYPTLRLNLFGKCLPGRIKPTGVIDPEILNVTVK